MSHRNLLLAPGVFLGDEVTQSGDPPKHADDLVATILREGLRWCALQISPGNETAAALLREACAQRGAGFGTWAQGLPAADEVAGVRAYGSTFHIANVEAPHEDQAWTDAAFDELVSLKLPNGLAVIFTEGAWGRDRERSRRWRRGGFAAIPEAIVSENPQATIGAMLELAAALGWPGERTAPCLYLTRGFGAAGYGGQIALTAGRWSLFRYGDVDQADWDAMREWPRAAPPATLPDADPEPRPKPKPVEPKPEPSKHAAAARALKMRADIVAAVERWNPAPPPSSRGAIVRRIANANDAAWRAAAPEILAALDAAGVPGGDAPPDAPPPAPPN
jgi:hypothetical protein